MTVVLCWVQQDTTVNQLRLSIGLMMTTSQELWLVRQFTQSRSACLKRSELVEVGGKERGAANLLHEVL